MNSVFDTKFLPGLRKTSEMSHCCCFLKESLVEAFGVPILLGHHCTDVFLVNHSNKVKPSIIGASLIFQENDPTKAGEVIKKSNYIFVFVITNHRDGFKVAMY